MSSKLSLKDLILFPFWGVFLVFVFIFFWVYLSCDWVYTKIRRVKHD